ncbi:MAG: indole-3-glycerol phosphate synthase TrpC [Actinomycetota bacterium]|nr:indole-3-glycerol phosphate synthase TrpC [Actinomycetota bacterium]
MNELERIVARTRTELASRPDAISSEELERAGARRGEIRPFAQAISHPGLSLIAEHKRRSPSAGLIRDDLGLPEVVGAYERGGAAALSILTEGPGFGGSLEHLGTARAAAGLPILRKDFILDPRQVVESLAAGADAILLIAAALNAQELVALHLGARAAGLSALVEVRDERELYLALDAGAGLIGINNRDLGTLEVDVRRTFELLPHVPPGVITVAESGFSEPEELEELAQAGVDAVLVGEALMRSADIEEACRRLVGPQ